MIKSPAFQFYVQDFLVGTRHFTTEEVGAYILLLCEQWDSGSIPNDDKILKKITGISAKKLQNVLKKFSQSDEGFLNERLEKERQKQVNHRLKRAASGSVGGSVRARRMQEAKAKGDHTKDDWNQMLKFFECCVRCGSSDKALVKDHIVPIYQGGSNGIDNIQPLCIKCNSSKGPESTDHRVLWCQANAKQMPSKWYSKNQAFQSSSSTSSSEYSESGGQATTRQPQTGGNATGGTSMSSPKKSKSEKCFSSAPRKKISAPEPSEVLTYFRELKAFEWSEDRIAAQASKWFDYYSANGWKVGRNPMKDWKAAVRNWIKNDFDHATHTTNPNRQNSPSAGRNGTIADLNSFKRNGDPGPEEQPDFSDYQIAD